MLNSPFPRCSEEENKLATFLFRRGVRIRSRTFLSATAEISGQRSTPGWSPPRVSKSGAVKWTRPAAKLVSAAFTSLDRPIRFVPISRRDQVPSFRHSKNEQLFKPSFVLRRASYESVSGDSSDCARGSREQANGSGGFRNSGGERPRFGWGRISYGRYVALIGVSVRPLDRHPEALPTGSTAQGS